MKKGFWRFVFGEIIKENLIKCLYGDEVLFVFSGVCTFSALFILAFIAFNFNVHESIMLLCLIVFPISFWYAVYNEWDVKTKKYFDGRNKK